VLLCNQQFAIGFPVKQDPFDAKKVPAKQPPLQEVDEFEQFEMVPPPIGTV